MPDDVSLPIFKIRGMRCSKLIKIVHIFGGILGPAHPFGVASSSAMGFKNMDMRLIKKFDFIETFNTCESRTSNRRAEILAEEYGLPTFAGSDAHVTEYIGMACTEIDADIRCNNDLITAVKNGTPIKAYGTERGETKKGKRKEHWIGILGFRIYNRGIGKIIYPYRRLRHHKALLPVARPFAIKRRRFRKEERIRKRELEKDRESGVTSAPSPFRRTVKTSASSEQSRQDGKTEQKNKNVRIRPHLPAILTPDIFHLSETSILSVSLSTSTVGVNSWTSCSYSASIYSDVMMKSAVALLVATGMS